MRGGTTPFVSADRGPNKDFVEDVFDISKWSEDSLIMKVYGDDKNICVSYMIFLVAIIANVWKIDIFESKMTNLLYRMQEVSIILRSRSLSENSRGG